MEANDMGDRGQILFMEKGEVFELELAFCNAGADRAVARLTDDQGVLLKNVAILVEESTRTRPGKVLQMREMGENELLQTTENDVISTSLAQKCRELKLPYINLGYGYSPIVFSNEVCWLDPFSVYGQRYYVMDSKKAEQIRAEV